MGISVMVMGFVHGFEFEILFKNSVWRILIGSRPSHSLKQCAWAQYIRKSWSIKKCMICYVLFGSGTLPRDFQFQPRYFALRFSNSNKKLNCYQNAIPETLKVWYFSIQNKTFFFLQKWNYLAWAKISWMNGC